MLGYRMKWDPEPFSSNPEFELSFDLEFVISHLMLYKKAVYFIQIGANDGVSNDPLHKFITSFGWEGILVEPVPYAFAQLSDTYKNHKSLHLINAALSDTDGFRTLYTVRMKGIGFEKAHQFSSFCKQSILSQKKWVPDIEQRIEENKVQCISFETLIQRANGREIDLLQMDVEGFDFEVLKMIDFSRLRPSIICFEHSHGSKKQQNDAARLLCDQGYGITRGNSDTVAYLPKQTFGFYWPKLGT